MNAAERREFAARLDALADAVACVEAFGAAQSIARDDLLRLTLIVEELFTNSVQHGPRGDGDRRIAIALQAEASCIRLVYEDDAPPFDPLAARDAIVAAVNAPADERPVGGLGIHLVVQLASRVDYEHVHGRNRLVVELTRRA
jgi:anti-sigma regulatory factor (Ser/Thr protein kinase)